MSVLAPDLRIPRTARVDERAKRAVRAGLTAQIERLERRKGLLVMELWESGRAALPPQPDSGGGAPRLLTLGELEAVRDALAGQVMAAELVLGERADSQARARSHLESMLAEPTAHRFEILSRAQLGEPGCGAYHVLPRWGVLGMLFGWWCVKLSSGCP
jgi:hypothetical protein